MFSTAIAFSFFKLTWATGERLLERHNLYVFNASRVCFNSFFVKTFLGTSLTGSEHNDEFYTDEHGKIRTRTNRSGGIQVFVV